MAEDFWCYWSDEKSECDRKLIEAPDAKSAALEYVRVMEWQDPKPTEDGDSLRVYVEPSPRDRIERESFLVECHYEPEWSVADPEDDDGGPGTNG